MSRYLLFFVLVLTLVSCSPVQPSQVPTETAVVLTSTHEPTSTPVPPTPTLTPEELLKTHPEIVAVEQYGMPQKMAQQLEGLNISFEENLPNVVKSVLVQEAGIHLFFKDEHGTWIEVNQDEDFSEFRDTLTNFIPEDEVFNGALLAKINYLASQMVIDYKNIVLAPHHLSSLGKTQILYHSDEEIQDELSAGKKIGIEREVYFGYTMAACSADGAGECYQPGKEFVNKIRAVLYLDPNTEKASPAITGQVCYISKEECLSEKELELVEWEAYDFFTPLSLDVEDISGYSHPLIQKSIKEMGGDEKREAAIQEFLGGDYDAFNKQAMILGTNTMFSIKP